MFYMNIGKWKTEGIDTFNDGSRFMHSVEQMSESGDFISQNRMKIKNVEVVFEASFSRYYSL